MGRDRWRRIEELYHAALERQSNERVVFLTAACQGDAELRQEIESLLAQHSGSLLPGPAWEQGPSLLDRPALVVDAQLGPYRVIGTVGSGGMGEVYRARDSKLKREVAIKVLPAAFADDPDRMSRFQREAQVLASLNHPNIAAIYGLEESNGVCALVMELVEGPTLAERIKRGAVPLEESLRIARQIADALEAAHEKGIVHRDLKPGNIKIRPDGAVKVLDFGLAKITEPTEAAGRTENSPTLTMEQSTRAGLILGTAGYMAPEQARGRRVDKRADIWAFGVVFYEMLTGEELFGGETVSDTLAAVLEREPQCDRVPAKVRRLLKKCLEKDPQRRLRDIGDAWGLLEETAEARPARARHSWVPWAASAALAVALGAVLWAPWRKSPPAPEVKRYQIPMKPDPTWPFVPSVVSPDGRYLAYMVLERDGWRLWIRSLDSLQARAVPGSESTGNAVYPFWSPDSQYIAFTSGGKLRKVSISGGPPQSICDVTMQRTTSGSWNRDGAILVGDGGAILRVSDTGGTLSAVVAPHGAEKRGGFFPFFLPDGRHFLYYGSTTQVETGGIYIGSLDAKPETQDTKALLAAAAAPIFAADPDQPTGSDSGYLLYARDRTLLSQRFDAKRLQLVGEAVPVADHVGRFGILPSYSVSINGVLIYHPGTITQQFQLTLFDRKGKTTVTLGEPAFFNGLAAFSPDGKHIALSIIDFTKSPPTDDLWISDLRGFRTRLTFGGTSYSPIWSPDGRRIAFARGNGKMYWKAADGTGDEEMLPVKGQNPTPTSWSQDGRYLLYDVQGEGQNNRDIWVLPLGGVSKPFPFLSTPANESGGSFSPDGRWVAYNLNETDSYEIYVRPFPPSIQGKWLVSKGAPSLPRWRQDGKELGYVAADGSVIAVPVTANPVFQPGEPKVLFKRPPNADPLGSTQDRTLFLMAVPVAGAASAPEPFTVVLNWTSLLKK